MTDKNDATTAVRVVGIIKISGMSLMFATDSAIVGTTAWYESLVNTHDLYSSAMVKIGNLENLDPISAAIEKRLNGRADRDTDDRVYVIDARQFAEMMQECLGMVSLFLVAIGGISLLVAAVAIFNVMLMSVNERIREIGILVCLLSGLYPAWTVENLDSVDALASDLGNRQVRRLYLFLFFKLQGFRWLSYPRAQKRLEVSCKLSRRYPCSIKCRIVKQINRAGEFSVRNRETECNHRHHAVCNVFPVAETHRAENSFW